MTLRATLALALAVLAAAATAAVGWSSLRATSAALHDEVDRSIEAALEQWSRPVRPQGRPAPWGDAASISLQLLDGGGAPVAATGPVTLPVTDVDLAVASGDTAAEVRRDVEIDGEPYRLFTRPLGPRTGALQAARSMAETDRVLSRLRARTAWAVVAVAAGAAALGWLVARQATRRLTRLTAAAEEVTTTGRLDVPVPEGGRDEAGRLAHAFNGMLAALRRSRDAQQRLVQDAGHELRTPLTSVRTNIDVLRRHPDLAAPERAQVLDDLERESRELTDLVDELVVLATDGPGEEEPPAPVDLGPLARRAAERTQRRTGRVVLVTADDSVVSGQAALLDRAIGNLIDNAAKFDGSGAPVEIDVHAGRVEVRDRGPGIPEEDRPLVFERFHRAVTARALPGSGLGLAIVAEVARSHGGHVFAEARPGGGAVVGFALPTLFSPDASPPHTPAAHAAEARRRTATSEEEPP